MKRFAIYDHGVLRPQQFVKPEKLEAFNQTQTCKGTTTKNVRSTAINLIETMGFDPAIIRPALKNIPKQEVEKSSFHYITMRWS